MGIPILKVKVFKIETQHKARKQILVYLRSHFIEHLVGLLLSSKACCANINIYRHLLKQSDKCYREHLLSFVNATCRVLPKYVLQRSHQTLGKPKGTHTIHSESPWRTFTLLFTNLQVVLSPNIHPTLHHVTLYSKNFSPTIT